MGHFFLEEYSPLLLTIAPQKNTITNKTVLGHNENFLKEQNNVS